MEEKALTFLSSFSFRDVTTISNYKDFYSVDFQIVNSSCDL